MKACNAAANYAAQVAFDSGTASTVEVQKLSYYDIRETYGISAQMAIRAIAKACGAYKRDKNIQPKFRKTGAIAYDPRILSFKGRDRVSILTLEGRRTIPVLYQGRWRDQSPSAVMRGEADLIYRKGKFYLAVVIDIPDQPKGDEPEDWIGVDLGITNIATDSDGNIHSGAQVTAVRDRRLAHRSRLQSKGTKSAKRRLKKLSGKERRFATDVNHTISKRLVAQAKDTDRGLRVEDLTGIRQSRKPVRKAQRAARHRWAFHQLRLFIQYKATIAGVHVQLINPAYTSQECQRCHHTEEANRSGEKFRCRACGFNEHADRNAAVNIRFRVPANGPNAAAA
jgi:IS605 OrfB family transposase